MTTIVATRSAIYADTLCTYTHPFKVKKIEKIGQSIYAGSGDLDNVQKFFAWRREGGDLPTVLDEQIDILEVCSDGIFIWGNKFVRLHVDEDIYSIGSGAHYAMGAIAMGASPRRAIEVAAMFDPQTGHPINVVKLKGR